MPRRIYQAYGLGHLPYDLLAQRKEAAAQRFLDDIDERRLYLKQNHVSRVEARKIRKEIKLLLQKAKALIREAEVLFEKDPLDEQTYAEAFSPDYKIIWSKKGGKEI